MKYYLLTAAGPDRAGIVASVAKALFELGCNLEDSAMTRLQGEFAILLIFSAPAKVKASLLSKRLGALKKRGLIVHCKPLAARERRAPAAKGALCLVTVYGGDKPGIVYRVTDLMARRGVNVTDLATHRTEAGGPGYILYVEGEAPAGTGAPDLEKALRETTRDLGVTVSVKALESSSL